MIDVHDEHQVKAEVRRILAGCGVTRMVAAVWEETWDLNGGYRQLPWKVAYWYLHNLAQSRPFRDATEPPQRGPRSLRRVGK